MLLVIHIVTAVASLCAVLLPQIDARFQNKNIRRSSGVCFVLALLSGLQLQLESGHWSAHGIGMTIVFVLLFAGARFATRYASYR